MSAIPTKRREQVKARESGRCLRCQGRGAEWHHRRSRRVTGDHQHCTCNGVWLCNTCHRWAHAKPARAFDTGFVVSTFITEPSRIAVTTLRGDIYLDCDGRYQDQPNGDNDHGSDQS